MAELVEGFDSYGLPIVLIDSLEHGARCSLPKDTGRAPHVILRASQEGHFRKFLGQPWWTIQLEILELVWVVLRN